MDSHLSVLQFSTADVGGGAENVAVRLFDAYRDCKLTSWLAVGYKRGDDPDVFVMPNDMLRSPWARGWLAIGKLFATRQTKTRWRLRIRRWAELTGQPRRLLEVLSGHEEFDFPATWRVLDLPPARPHLVHCHNLHGGYFDLRALPWLSRQVPVVLTLHDAWLLSGHCAHSFDCERWETGCGHCPDLTIYPAIKRDATAYNWQTKQEIFANSRFYVATPSRWLMHKVKRSILAPAVREARVIPNGVDLSVFRPRERMMARAEVGLPENVKVLLFAASGIRENNWKDYQTMRAAVAQVAARLAGQKVLFVALGDDAPTERIGQAEICFVPYQRDPKSVARYYQAADVYIHAAHAEVWGLTVTEALACGTPVVATAVGGIPEQVHSLSHSATSPDQEAHGRTKATGILVRPRDPEAMAASVVALLTEDGLRDSLGNNAARDARQRFGVERQVDAYLSWYHDIVEEQKREGGCLAQPDSGEAI